MFLCKVCMRNCAHIRGLVENALSRVHGRLAPDRGWAPVQPWYNRSEEDETRTPLQKAINDAESPTTSTVTA